MILRVELENFMGCNTTVDLFQETMLKGHNGSHKTTILHAIAFALCGTDAWGNQAPIFMISNETDKMKVIIHTERSVIQRSLTRKKSSNLRLKVNDIWNTINQTDMVGWIGPADHILSVLNPKFFFSLSDDKKKALIVNIFPKVDRLELVESITGFKVKHFDESHITCREPLRAASLFAEKRRDIAKRLHTRDMEEGILSSRREQLETMLGLGGFATPEEEAELKMLQNRKYQYDLAFAQYITRLEFVREAALSTADRKKELENKIVVLSEDLKVAEQADSGAEGSLLNIKLLGRDSAALVGVLKKGLAKKIDEAPRGIASISLPSKDYCPTCAQPVSKRHRDRIEAENKEAEEDYRVTSDAHNQRIAAARGLLQEAEMGKDKLEQTYRNGMQELGALKFKVDTIRGALESAKQGLEEEENQELKEPKAPEKNFSQERLDELEKSLKDKKPSRSRIEALSERDSLIFKMENIKKEYAGEDDQIEYYFKLEEALKRIPEKEMALLEKVTSFGNYKIDTDVKGLITTKEGIPYTMMSTGQKMCAETLLSLQINTHLQRRMSLIFLDDSELIDPKSMALIMHNIRVDGIQTVRTKVGSCGFQSLEVPITYEEIH